MYRANLHSKRKRFEYAVKRVQGLVGYYLLNEVEGTTARNSAPANKGSFDGVIAGSPTIGSTGRLGRAYVFDGVNDTIAVAGFPVNSHNVKSFFCLTNGAAANTNMTGFGTATTSRTGLSFQTTGLLRLELPSNVANSTIRITSPTNSLPLNTWGAVGYSMLEIDPAVARVVDDGDIYINGVVQTKASVLVGAASGAQTQMNLGSYAAGNGFLNGRLQHPAYFNRILAASEFLRLAHKAGFV